MTVYRARFLSVVTLLLAGLVMAALPAAAQQKIAVIDTREIIFESQLGKTALEQLNQLQQQKEAELQTQQTEVQTLRNRLNEGRLSLSEDKLAELAAELETKTKELRRQQEDAAAELDRRRNQTLKQIEDKVMPVINQIGEEQGYSLIFNKFESGLVFADEAVDITGAVIQRLDSGAAAGK